MFDYKSYARAYYQKNKIKLAEKAIIKYHENPDKIRERRRKWYAKNKDKARNYRKKYRLKVLENYGNKCECCGENNQDFLTIDHVNGGGTQHRKEIKVHAGYHFYIWLIKNNYPSGYQVLCYNCHLAKSYRGRCPHTLKGGDI